jgi:YidC/Oxa1 family membrane protein insertase
LQPAIKDIQLKYQSNPEVMNQKIAEMYQTNNVNPLAGCIPSLVQIPVFIGLYRAVLELAKDNKLDEPFLWLPNLEGPVYGADPTKGSAWLFEGWTNGAPSLGWEDTIAFLILPVFLVISQFISMEIMTPKDSQQQGNFVLKLLPLMIGWFSLNVPAALCLYWVTNNIVTTATSVIIRNSMKMEPVAVVGGGASSTTSSPTRNEIFAPSPLREKPAGFSDGVTRITGDVIDAEFDSEGEEEDGAAGEGMGDEQKKVRLADQML